MKSLQRLWGVMVIRCVLRLMEAEAVDGSLRHTIIILRQTNSFSTYSIFIV